MHGRVVGELGGDERVVSSVCNGRVTMEEDTVSLGSYLFSQTQPTLRLPHVVHHHPTPSRYR